MLSFAGVTLSPFPDGLASVYERFAVREAVDQFSHPGYGVDALGRFAAPAPPPRESPRLNTLQWPTGASRYAVFHSVVGGAGAASIKSLVNTDAPTAKTLLISDEDADTSVSASMFLLDVRPVFARSPTVTEQLYWLTLVDARYYWWTRNLVAVAGGTWSALLTNLVTAASGLVPTVPAVPVSYGTPTRRWTELINTPFPPLIDAAAASVGLRFVYNLDGTAEFKDATAAGLSSAAQYTLYESHVGVGGRQSASDLAGEIPASVNVRTWGTGANTSNVTLASLAIPDYGAMAGVANTSGWFFYDQEGAISSPASAITAATAYYRWALSRVDATFRGIRPWTPTGLEDRLEWEYMPGRANQYPDHGPTRSARTMAADRVCTRVVPADRGDRNVYGSGAAKSVTQTATAAGLIVRQNLVFLFDEANVTMPAALVVTPSGSISECRVGGWVDIFLETNGPVDGAGDYNGNPVALEVAARIAQSGGPSLGKVADVLHGQVYMFGTFFASGDVYVSSTTTGFLPFFGGRIALPEVITGGGSWTITVSVSRGRVPMVGGGPAPNWAGIISGSAYLFCQQTNQLDVMAGGSR